MTVTLQQVFERLPAEIRKLDHKEGHKVLARQGSSAGLTEPEDYGPIKSIISAMLREGQIVEQDIAQLYDDHFIETCADWVVPYIGELVGALSLEPIPGTDNHRRFVAATLATRRSKGTLATLEYSAAAATGWPIHAVEYWKRTATTPSMRRPQFQPQSILNIRDIYELDKIGSAFESSPRSFHAHSVETMQGRWNLPNIGLHVFRLKSYPVGNGEERQEGSSSNTTRNYGYIVRKTHNGSRQYRFHPLGCDAPLFKAPPDQEPRLGERRRAADLPVPIRRLEFDQDKAQFFGPGKAFNIIVRKGATVTQLGLDDVKAANLGDSVPNSGTESWPSDLDPELTYIDPQTGRFILSSSFTGNFTVFVSFHEGRAIEIGGHQRELSDIPGLLLPGAITMRGNTGIPNVPNFPSGTDPLDIHFEHSTDYRFDGHRNGPNAFGVDIFRVIAMERAWPTLAITEQPNGKIDLRLICKPNSTVLLSGLRFKSLAQAQSNVKILGDDVRLEMRDCTLIPGHDLDPAGEPIAPGAPSLRISDGQTAIIERSILGPIEIGNDVELVLNDCVIDAGSYAAKAIIPLAGSRGHSITLNRCTVIGQIKADRLGGGDHYTEQAQATLASFPLRRDKTGVEIPRGIRDSLILAIATEDALPIDIMDIQTGCVRHSFIPPDSRVPRKFACAPKARARQSDWPQLSSRRYLDPAYMQLSLTTSNAILEGASNGSEMGVGSDQNSRARRANLTRIIEDQLRFGLQAGPIYEN
ncbi:hypothetical protein N9W89_07670 [Hellea sp.]|nr:hypothetical protein [Hellea sp.]